MQTPTEMPDERQVWEWLAEVPDPEIPVLSVVDLGIVREVRREDGTLVVAITPTYSGCPATAAISRSIEENLRGHGVEQLRLENRISPPWTTDWLSDQGREKLRAYGIAPPGEEGPDTSSPFDRMQGKRKPVACPFCGSTETEKVSEFGSTPCKAQYRCQDCLEPFDYFKCI